MKDQMRAPQAVGTVGPWGQVVSSEPEEVRFCRNCNLRMGASCWCLKKTEGEEYQTDFVKR